MPLTHNTRQTAMRHRSRGAAAVEFALVLFVLMLVVAGIVEIGRALWYYDALSKGTRDAARYLSTVPAAELNASLDEARSIVLASGETARVQDLLDNQITARCDAPAIATCSGVVASQVTTVTVSVSYPMTLGEWVPFLPAGGGASSFAITLQPHTTMRYMW